MIRLLVRENHHDFLSILDSCPVASTRIRTFLAVYGMEDRDVMFWLHSDDIGKPHCAICSVRGSFTLCGIPDADTRELTEFLSVMGCRNVAADPDLLDRMEISYNMYSVMMYTKIDGANEATCSIIVPLLSDVYNLLCECDREFKEHTIWEEWYVHSSHIVRHGLGHNAGIYKDGVLASTGGIYTSDDKSCVIGGVATHPAYRGKGYARDICAHHVGLTAESGRNCCIVCENRLEGFYESIGFERCGFWGESR